MIQHYCWLIQLIRLVIQRPGTGHHDRREVSCNIQYLLLYLAFNVGHGLVSKECRSGIER